MSDLIEIIRREAMQIVGARQFKGTLVCTGYNKKTHAIKGILVPQEVETGWIPISVNHAGKGFGVLVGPNIGDAKKLDGDVFDVEFENGDPNTPIAKHKHFSAVDNPPEVESGEIMVKHQTGGSTYFAKDGSITTTHKDGGTHAFDKDGHHTLDSKNKNVTVKSGTGSQNFEAANIGIKGSIKVDGDIDQTGNHTVSGTVAGTGGVTSGGLPVRTA